MRYEANTLLWGSSFSSRSMSTLETIASLGFDVVEITVEDPDVIDAVELRRRLVDLNLQAAVCAFHTAVRDPRSEDAAARSRAAEHLMRCADVASAIGAPFVCGPLYCSVGVTGRRTPAERDAQASRAASTIAEVAARASRIGVRFGIEPLNRYETDLINTVDQGLSFLRLVDRDDVRLLLDSYHMNIEERDVPAAIR